MDHMHFLNIAIEEGQKALQHGDFPVGAVVVFKNEVIGYGFNTRERDNDPVGHAEINALKDAGRFLKNKHLIGCDLYVTHEPCPMCAGALIMARIKRVIYGCSEPVSGSCGSLMNLLQFPSFMHNVRIIGPIDQERCANIGKKFFLTVRTSSFYHQ